MIVGKKEFAAKMAEIGNTTKAEAERAVDTFLEALSFYVAEQEEIKFVGYLSVEVKEKDARMGRNPQTGEAIEIPAHNVVKMSAGKTLKELANMYI